MIEGLKGKVVILTEGGHGIGKTYCLGFGKAGAQVVAADIDNPAAPPVAAQVAKETGAKSLGLRVKETTLPFPAQTKTARVLAVSSSHEI